ncbi:hypothetical protein BFJ66_g13043 [Fusarium oxysporum f. sp. cepae]|uniref:Uncharacterized protein n=1 Tax=Fusarium oxysporum f. sp. cepae TaxID=396571 RepID=A0A3L6NN02_FUSOX|nr:hypothetical protein BFJ65_g6698 [Fusarium oxysporum f. sp. cepae]RKK34601.1 hypothetical protein BFJ67_g13719 [Fusarium oxysporum f. sp. cepae]RKK37274.1 hypothetical protein BFJ66_g13043 [Fusarium oxysporum f. sp. cepae]
MSSVQKLVHHWKQGQFIPGGKPPQPLNDEAKGQRLSELNGDDMITPEITKGISILKDAVEAFKKTQEFNRNPTSFIGDTRDVLMSDDYLLVADVLRLIFPEGMISKVWQLKRGRDEDLDTRDNDPAPGNRTILIPKSKKRRLDILGGQEESMNSERAASRHWAFGSKGSETRQEHKTGGLFGIPASKLRFTNGSEAQETTNPLFGAEATGYTGLFGVPASKLRFTNGPEAQQEHKTGGLFGVPASKLGFTNGSEAQKATGPLFGALSAPEAPGHTGIFGAKAKGSNNSPALQHAGIFSAKSPTPEYTGIFSQRIGFTPEKPTNPAVSGVKEKGSDTLPTPQHTGIFGAKSSEPQTGGIFSTTSPGLGYTGTFSQRIGSLSGNKEEVIIDKPLSLIGGDEVNKSLAQLQLLGQQGTKRKHEKEEETMNKMRNNVKAQEPYNLITF